ncbi:unnamed protein product [Phytomonas sp. Hart1]|nr:unnamed protein product [Phytomonas sp. Hart1]|eukprot:CCW71620.1 unnamed protein product [Phytomonas sp. isolate Hart1]
MSRGEVGELDADRAVRRAGGKNPQHEGAVEVLLDTHPVDARDHEVGEVVRLKAIAKSHIPRHRKVRVRGRQAGVEGAVLFHTELPVAVLGDTEHERGEMRGRLVVREPSLIRLGEHKKQLHRFGGGHLENDAGLDPVEGPLDAVVHHVLQCEHNTAAVEVRYGVLKGDPEGAVVLACLVAAGLGGGRVFGPLRRPIGPCARPSLGPSPWIADLQQGGLAASSRRDFHNALKAVAVGKLEADAGEPRAGDGGVPQLIMAWRAEDDEAARREVVPEALEKAPSDLGIRCGGSPFRVETPRGGAGEVLQGLERVAAGDRRVAAVDLCVGLLKEAHPQLAGLHTPREDRHVRDRG